MVVLGISGSLRAGSHNTRLLDAAARLLPEGVELRRYEGLKEVPPYDEDEDRDPAPEPVARLRAAVAAADAVLIATPEYNHSLPGQLKNALDWLSRPAGAGALRNVPAAVIGASTGAFGAVWAQAEVRKVLGAVGARVVEGDLALGHAHEHLAADGTLTDGERVEQLREVLGDLVAEAYPGAEAASTDPVRGGRFLEDEQFDFDTRIPSAGPGALHPRGGAAGHREPMAPDLRDRRVFVRLDETLAG